MFFIDIKWKVMWRQVAWVEGESASVHGIFHGVTQPHCIEPRTDGDW